MIKTHDANNCFYEKSIETSKTVIATTAITTVALETLAISAIVLMFAGGVLTKLTGLSFFGAAGSFLISISGSTTAIILSIAIPSSLLLIATCIYVTSIAITWSSIKKNNRRQPVSIVPLKAKLLEKKKTENTLKKKTENTGIKSLIETYNKCWVPSKKEDTVEKFEKLPFNEKTFADLYMFTG